MLAPSRQRCHAAGVDEIQARQIDDDRQVAGRDRRERSRDTHSVCYIKLPAQRDDNVTVAFAGTQIHAEHGGAFLLQQQGGVLTQRRVYRYSVYTLRPISSGGDALLTAVPVRSATGPGRWELSMLGPGQANPLALVSPHAVIWTRTSMTATPMACTGRRC